MKGNLMFCKKCGSQLLPDVKFCKKCGTPVRRTETDEEAENQDSGTIVNEPVNVEQQPEQPEDRKPKKKRKKKRIGRIILCLLLILAVLCALATQFHIGLWVIQNNSENDSEIEVSNQSDSGKVYTLDQDSVKQDETTGINYVNNIVIVFFNNGTSEDDVQQVVDFLEGEIVGSIPGVNQYQIRVSQHSYEELTQLCTDVQNFDFVNNAFVDQAIKLKEDVVPDDPWKKVLFYFGDKWSEDNPNGSNWWQEAINAPSAWEYNDYLETIKIGIVDNGFDTTHEDLSGVIKSTTDNNEAESHGTHVAGIIGATPNNKCGITGIVWNGEIYSWDWELSDDQQEEEQYSGWNTTTQIMQGVVALISSKGAKVINLSAGQAASMDELTRTQEYVDSQAENISTYLQCLLWQGYDFVIVQSAGNGNADGYSVDAIYNGLFCSINEENCVTSDDVTASDIINRIIVVGAAQNEGNNQYKQAEFSNAGSHVDICAPGKDMYSTVPGGYKNMSGTSMAAPIVTGVASLVWSANSELTGEEVKTIVCDSDNTKYTVEDNTSEKHPLTDSYRLVNAELAVKAGVKAKQGREKDEAGELDENPVASKEEREADAKHFSGVVLTPEDVVLKMYDALQDGDYEFATECLDPATEQQIDFLGGIASTVVGLFTGEYISWGQLLLEAAGATDVEVIECNSYNMEYESNMDIFSELLHQIPGLNNLICTEADVYVKYRYKYNDEYYIEEENYHVRRYEWSGWRIEAE